MGLLMSILVVCVGVLEAISCFRHIQNGYLPFWMPDRLRPMVAGRRRRKPSADDSSSSDEVGRILLQHGGGVPNASLRGTSGYGLTPILTEHRRHTPIPLDDEDDLVAIKYVNNIDENYETSRSSHSHDSKPVTEHFRPISPSDLEKAIDNSFVSPSGKFLEIPETPEADQRCVSEETLCELELESEINLSNSIPINTHLPNTCSTAVDTLTSSDVIPSLPQPENDKIILQNDLDEKVSSRSIPSPLELSPIETNFDLENNNIPDPLTDHHLDQSAFFPELSTPRPDTPTLKSNFESHDQSAFFPEFSTSRPGTPTLKSNSDHLDQSAFFPELSTSRPGTPILKSKADISWPVFHPDAPVIRRPLGKGLSHDDSIDEDDVVDVVGLPVSALGTHLEPDDEGLFSDEPINQLSSPLVESGDAIGLPPIDRSAIDVDASIITTSEEETINQLSSTLDVSDHVIDKAPASELLSDLVAPIATVLPTTNDSIVESNNTYVSNAESHFSKPDVDLSCDTLEKFPRVNDLCGSDEPEIQLVEDHFTKDVSVLAARDPDCLVSLSDILLQPTITNSIDPVTSEHAHDHSVSGVEVESTIPEQNASKEVTDVSETFDSISVAGTQLSASVIEPGSHLPSEEVSVDDPPSCTPDVTDNVSASVIGISLHPVEDTADVTQDSFVSPAATVKDATIEGTTDPLPANDISVDNAVNASVELPVTSSVDSQVHVTIDTPVTVCADASVDFAVDTPVTVSKDSPDNNVVSTPVDIPVETPVDVSIETPADEPVETPVETPIEPPVAAKVTPEVEDASTVSQDIVSASVLPDSSVHMSDSSSTPALATDTSDSTPADNIIPDSTTSIVSSAVEADLPTNATAEEDTAIAIANPTFTFSDTCKKDLNVDDVEEMDLGSEDSLSLGKDITTKESSIKRRKSYKDRKRSTPKTSTEDITIREVKEEDTPSIENVRMQSVEDSEVSQETKEVNDGMKTERVLDCESSVEVENNSVRGNGTVSVATKEDSEPGAQSNGYEVKEERTDHPRELEINEVAEKTAQNGKELEEKTGQNGKELEEKTGQNVKEVCEMAGQNVKELDEMTGQNDKELEEKTGQNVKEVDEMAGQNVKEVDEMTGQNDKELEEKTGQNVKEIGEMAGPNDKELEEKTVQNVKEAAPYIEGAPVHRRESATEALLNKSLLPVETLHANETSLESGVFATTKQEQKRLKKPARASSFEEATADHQSTLAHKPSKRTPRHATGEPSAAPNIAEPDTNRNEPNTVVSDNGEKPNAGYGEDDDVGESSEATVTSNVQRQSSSQPAFWLIFSGEYTKAMSKDWHSGHFCCWQCDESLTGQRYVLRDDHPYCIKCYESVFANMCEECNKTIGIDSKDLSYKDKHWHEACFLCNKCRVSLVDKQFGSKADKIYCGNCYDSQFASRCDGCGEIFRAGTKKMEYKTRQWHEKCFCCCVCKSAIGTKSFIPREQEIYCATCYEEKFATRCVKCNKIITSGGVTYKNEPWHRECFTCTHCNTSLAGQRFTSRDEKPYCAECFGELFAKRCTACVKPITGIGGTRFISFEDRHWHNDCFICASCKASLVGRGFITDAEDIICPECAKQKLM